MVAIFDKYYLLFERLSINNRMSEEEGRQEEIYVTSDA